MADPVVTPAEMAALMSGGPAAKGQSVADCDLASIPRIPAPVLAGLRRILESRAPLIAIELAAALRGEVTVQLTNLGELSGAVLMGSVPDPAAIALIDLTAGQPAPSRGLAVWDLKLVSAMIDRLLGGSGKAQEKPLPPTNIEQRLLDRLTTSSIAAVAGGFAELHPLTIAITGSASSPGAVNAVPPGETAVVATFTIAAPWTDPGEWKLALPLAAVAPCLAVLATRTSFAPVAAGDLAQRQRIEKIIRGASWPVRVVLGTTTIDLGQILALVAGDVLMLDQRHDAPVAGFVGERLRLTGRPGKVGRRTAVQVERVIPAGSDANSR